MFCAGVVSKAENNQRYQYSMRAATNHCLFFSPFLQRFFFLRFFFSFHRVRFLLTSREEEKKKGKKFKTSVSFSPRRLFIIFASRSLSTAPGAFPYGWAETLITRSSWIRRILILSSFRGESLHPMKMQALLILGYPPSWVLAGGLSRGVPVHHGSLALRTKTRLACPATNNRKTGGMERYHRQQV